MKRIIIIVIAVLALVVPQAHAAGWSSVTKIASIEVSSVAAPGVWLTFVSQPSFPAPTPCGSSPQYWLGFGVNPDKEKQMTETAVMALIHSRQVTVYWNATCQGGYRVLRGITVK